MDAIKLALPTTAGARLDPELYQVINDLYVQIGSLVEQLNRYAGILKSPNGHYWRLTISNLGVITAVDLGTVLV